MNKTILAVLILAAAAMAANYREVHGRGSGTDMDESRAHSQAMDEAKDNLQNACRSGRWYQAPQVTKDECHPSGIGSVTCTVEISGSCED
jgi:hypothetical protein